MARAADNKDLRQIRRLANQALVDVFNALGGDRWRNKSGWLTPGTDVKKWHGVTVNAGSLVSLNLMSNDLEGTIPSTISNLVTLNELNMSYNFGVVGFLPREVGSMANLTVLHIYSAGIHGPIPDSLSLLGSLEELWLNGNRLSGIIPEGLGRLSHLRELYLNANELVGEIPCSFSELASLEGLNLSWNRLSGNFPACLSSMGCLRLLVLEGNEELEEVPPAEQGPGLLQWLSSKRAACANLPRRAMAEPKGAHTMPETWMEHASNLAHGPLLASNDPTPGWSPSLQEVLLDEAGPPFGLGAFKTFAAEQLVDENIEFWVEVEKFKKADESSCQQAVAALCSRFIAPGAPLEINLSGSVRATTMGKIHSFQTQAKFVGKAEQNNQCTLDRTIFDQAQRQIYNLTETDIFPRFIQYVRQCQARTSSANLPGGFR